MILAVVVADDQAAPLGTVYAGTRSDVPAALRAAHATPAVSVAATQEDTPADDTIDRSVPSPTDAALAAVPVPTASPTDAPTRAPATPAPASPAPVVTVATPRPTSAPVATPSGCPTSSFCYPRLGIRGQIVPYTDCSGATDVGTSIRAYTCLSPNYLMGHAYTQMGLITGWQAGDVVYAYGNAYTVYNALTEQSCQPPILPLAPLSMQTSLSPNTCGPVLVVQAR